MNSNQLDEFVHSSTTNLGFLLTRTATLWNERLMVELANLGFEKMKPSHGSVLIPLFDFGEQTITSIMKFSKLKKQTMTTYIRELKELGMIEEKKNVYDKRSKLISLTQLGQELKVGSNQAVNMVNDYFDDQLNEQEFEILHSILAKLLPL